MSPVINELWGDWIIDRNAKQSTPEYAERARAKNPEWRHKPEAKHLSGSMLAARLAGAMDDVLGSANNTSDANLMIEALVAKGLLEVMKIPGNWCYCLPGTRPESSGGRNGKVATSEAQKARIEAILAKLSK
jgi:hypothetical protein